jgi:hypothetical protein
MTDHEPNPPAKSFYESVATAFREGDLKFLVGGAFALKVYTGVQREVKDFDLMVRPKDLTRALQLAEEKGFRIERSFPHWLAKIHSGPHFVDLIYRAGNGLCEVDDSWFKSATDAEILGHPMKICPVEELLWQKAYIMERERFDGADVLHLIRSCAGWIDWTRLVERFGPDWRILLSHLTIFGFVYPGERNLVPPEVMEKLLGKLREEIAHPPAAGRICRGTLLSRAQYLADISEWGYADGRLDGRSRITLAELERWTDAIGDP